MMRKILLRGIFPNNNSGVVLIVVLWVLVILSMLALGLGRRSSVELELSKNSIGKLRSKYIAMAGLVYAMEKIEEDSNDMESSKIDTKFQCGFTLKEDQSPEDIFKNIKLKDGYFDISSTQIISSDNEFLRYGFTDEESKININAITHANKKVLANLIYQFDYGQDFVDALAESIVKWRFNAFSESSAETGEENMSLSVAHPLGSAEELLLVPGMTMEIYDKIRRYVTVFPREGRMLINFNTAEIPVLLALARTFSGNTTNTSLSDADSLVDKIVNYRDGYDGVWATEDDKEVDLNELPLVSKEQVIFLAMLQYQTKVSRYLRIKVRGTDSISSVVSDIEAVFSRDDLSLVYWSRN